MPSALRPRLPVLLLACVVLTLVARAGAQGHGGGQGSGSGGPGGPGRGPGGGGMGGIGGGGIGGLGGGMNRPTFPGNSPSGNFPGPRTSLPSASAPNSPRGGDSTLPGGLQLGPPGRWWDNADFARSIGIDPKQQRRMDDVFSENRGQLLQLYKSLQHEEKELAKTLRSKELDEAAIFAHIDRVTQARGELEKANAHYALQIRREMSPEQTSRLDERRPAPE